jgi:hypothetical protein
VIECEEYAQQTKKIGGRDNSVTLANNFTIWEVGRKGELSVKFTVMGNLSVSFFIQDTQQFFCKD